MCNKNPFSHWLETLAILDTYSEFVNTELIH